MNGGDVLGDFLEGLLLNAPVFIALAIGLVIALAHWVRNPTVALFGTLGFGWLSIVLFGAIAWNRVLVPEIFPDAGSTEEKLSYVALSVLEAIGYVFLMLAAFMYRRRPRAHPFLDDHDHNAPHNRV